MQIKVLGFCWRAGTPVTAAVLLDSLVARSGRTFRSGHLDRIAYWKRLKDPKGFVGGMLITVKDHRLFFELQRSGGVLKIVAQEVAEGRQIAEVNFVVINPASGLGMMTYYHGSWSVGAMCHWASQEHEKIRSERIEQAVAREATDSAQKRTRREARRSHDRMDWSHLVTNKKLQEMIKEMGAVKSFSYDVTATGSKGSTFRALMPGHVKTETKRFVFKKGTAPWSTVVGLAAKVIPGFVKKRGIERGKIVGEDAQGERSVINIVSNLQVYDHRDYDDSMAGLEIAPDEFMENDLFEWLLAEVQRNRAAL